MEQPSPGLWVIRYQQPEELDPARHEALLASIRSSYAELKQRAVLVFVVGAGIRSVDMAVPTYWLGITGASDCPIAAMGIVTTSLAVRAAATGFRLANTVRGLPVRVESFSTEADALTWAEGYLPLRAAS